MCGQWEGRSRPAGGGRARAAGPASPLWAPLRAGRPRGAGRPPTAPPRSAATASGPRRPRGLGNAAAGQAQQNRRSGGARASEGQRGGRRQTRARPQPAAGKDSGTQAGSAASGRTSLGLNLSSCSFISQSYSGNCMRYIHLEFREQF